MRFDSFAIGILFLALVRPLSSQTPLPSGIGDPGLDSLRTVNRPVETIDVHVHEVNLVLSVTDHRGKFVNSLRPSDLTILDDGVEQTKLTFFKRETDLPIKIALVLDISASVAYQFDEEKKAINPQSGWTTIRLCHAVCIQPERPTEEPYHEQLG